MDTYYESRRQHGRDLWDVQFVAGCHLRLKVEVIV